MIKAALNSFLALLIGAPLLLFAVAGEARETDQYTLPPDRLEDIGPLLSERVYKKLLKVADTVNSKIQPHASKLIQLEASYESGKISRKEYEQHRLDRLGWIRQLNAPAAIARRFKKEIGAGPLFFTGELEKWVESDELLQHYTALNVNAKVLFSPKLSETVYHAAVGPWMPMYLLRSPTIHVFGVEFGLDKLGHFMNEGYEYYKIYLENRAEGMDVRNSEMSAVKEFGTMMEGGAYGTVITGVYSNADLAAQYTGLKFYRNLTEGVDIDGEFHPSIFMVREDGTIKLAPRVSREQSTFLSIYIIPHFNEALNPSLYPLPIRNHIKKNMKERCQIWRDRYPGLNRNYFETMTRELSHWHGEDYGHSRDFDDLIRIGDSCFK